ncbi:mechanosensitive ion channel, partial [bacterium]|nr:mechanosensitive ion channel [bacterium]
MNLEQQLNDLNLHWQAAWMQTSIKVLLILIGSWLLWFVLKFVIRRSTVHLMQKREGESARRGQTLIDLSLNATKVLVLALAITLILGELGINLGPILAAAGVLGVAIGFGAQSLVADVLNGFFFIAENQVRVGDIVVAADKAGVVESIGLRTLSLRSFDGVLHIIPHSSVTVVSNMTHQYSRALVAVGVSYKEDPEQVARVLQEVAEEMRNDPE